jgi:hypothetical protein
MPVVTCDTIGNGEKHRKSRREIAVGSLRIADDANNKKPLGTSFLLEIDI